MTTGARSKAASFAKCLSDLAAIDVRDIMLSTTWLAVT